MKKNILKYVPFVVVVLLAASCSKDDNSGDDIVNQPLPTDESVLPEQTLEVPKTVTIPFSVKVDNGTSLSKIQYTEKNGTKGKVVSRSFVPDDCNSITLDLSGSQGVDSKNTKPLKLKQNGADYVFYGDIIVENNYAESFTQGDMTLTGTFTYDGKTDNTGVSTTSLVDLEENHCNHTYKADFKSGDKIISLVDQNAYLCFTVYEKQTEFTLTFNDEKTARTFTPDATTHKIWIAVPCGGNNSLPTVKGALISRIGKDLTPGTVYKVDRTDKYEEDGMVFVNLGISGTWWAETNFGASDPWDCGDYYAWGETTTKPEYDWSNYEYGSGQNSLTKYCSRADFGTNGFADELSVLGKYTIEGEDPVDDDVAHARNEKWFMPTVEEFEALKSSCYSVWTEDYNDSNTAGYIVYKDKGSDKGQVVTLSSGTANSNYSLYDTHIFIPCGGYKQSDALQFGDYECRYWSSNLVTDYPGYAFCLNFHKYAGYRGNSGIDRCNGLNVRAVRRM